MVYGDNLGDTGGSLTFTSYSGNEIDARYRVDRALTVTDWSAGEISATIPEIAPPYDARGMLQVTTVPQNMDKHDIAHTSPERYW